MSKHIIRPYVCIGHKLKLQLLSLIQFQSLLLLLPLAHTLVNALVPPSALEGVLQLPVWFHGPSLVLPSVVVCTYNTANRDSVTKPSWQAHFLQILLQILLSYVPCSLFALLCLAVVTPVKYLSFVLAKAYVVV